jgi:ATP-dependent Lhr-like helicase
VPVEGAFKLLPVRLQQALEALGYRRPTPVQEKAIPVVLRGFNAVIVAPTGSGKTEAALVPLMARLIGSQREGVKVVYVTPLRSLNRDIFVRMSRLASMVGLTMMVRHGDSTPSERRSFLTNPPDIVVTTPETLYFLLSVEAFRRAIRGLEAIVVDELHEMVDDKRGAELALALERLEDYSGRRVQRVGLSATVEDPWLAARMLAGPRYVVVVDARDLAKRMRIVVDSPTPKPDDHELARKLGVERSTTAARVRRIAELVSSVPGSVIVFTNTRDTAEVLGALLKKVIGEDRVLVHHGSLSREERLEAESKLRRGEVKVVVATSSLELGIDIGFVDLVIQYMSPRQALRLVQRVGRSRHRLGEESVGVIVASDNVFDVLESAVIAARSVRGNLEPQQPYRKPLDALAHQIAGSVIERGEVDVDTIYWMAVRTLPYHELGRDELDRLVDYLEWAGIVRRSGESIRPGRRAYRYYFEVTMIPETRQYPVYELASGRRIGVLDEEFVAGLEAGDVFVLGGRVWEVVSVESDRVVVKQAPSQVLVPPAWEGDLIPVDWRVAREVGSILRRFEVHGEKVLASYPLTGEARSLVASVLREHLGKGLPLPSDRRVVVESIGETVIVYAFMGSRGAKALELALAAASKQVKGYTPRTSSTPYAVVLSFASETPAEHVVEMLKMLAKLPWSEVEEMVLSTARRTKLFEWKLHHVAERMGAVDPNAKPDRRLLQRLGEGLPGDEALNELLHDKVELGPLRMLLKGIAENRVEVVAVNLREPSPLAKHVFSEARAGDKVAEQLPSTILAEVVRRRLEMRRAKMVCVRCGHTWEQQVSSITDRPRCPRCGVGFVAPVKLDPRKASEIVRKAWRREKLTPDERKVFNELREAANLVLSYGRKAVEALLVTGVGPATAKKVLQKLVFGEEAFYKALVEAEQRYLRTRQYWE